MLSDKSANAARSNAANWPISSGSVTTSSRSHPTASATSKRPPLSSAELLRSIPTTSLPADLLSLKDNDVHKLRKFPVGNHPARLFHLPHRLRSEERRVGKESTYRCVRYL